MRGEGGICQTNPSPCLISTEEDQISALNAINYYFSNHYRIASINLSLASGYYQENCDNIFRLYSDTIESLKRKNISVVSASGNNGYIDGISMPACLSSAISVGSTTKSDKISNFSNSARILDILAPGSDIYSSLPEGKYGYSSGTSMAAPHVAGAYAVLKERDPQASPNQILSLLAGNGIPIKDDRNDITKYRMLFNRIVPSSPLISN